MRRATAIVAVVVVALSAAGWWYYQNVVIYHGYTPRPFSREAWAQADAETRGHMLDDLLRQQPLVGKTLDEVTALLGPPDGGGTSGLRYQIGSRGYNPRALRVLYTLYIDADGGRVKRVYSDD